MFFEDQIEEKSCKALNNYLKDLENLAFFSPLQDKLQDYCDYSLIIDRMRKNLPNKLKLPDIRSDIVICKNRGFNTDEFLEIEKKTNDLVEWYQNYDILVEKKTNFKLNELLFKFDSNVKNVLFSEETLNNMINSNLTPYIDKQNMIDLILLKDNLKVYKKNFLAKISTINDLISLIKQGLTFNLWTYEFEFMFKRLEFDIKWLVNGVKLIKTYQKEFVAQSPDIIQEMIETLSPKKLENEISSNSYEFLIKILTNFEESERLKRTEEYGKLKEFKNESEKWSVEVHEVCFLNFYFLIFLILFTDIISSKHFLK